MLHKYTLITPTTQVTRKQKLSSVCDIVMGVLNLTPFGVIRALNPPLPSTRAHYSTLSGVWRLYDWYSHNKPTALRCVSVRWSLRFPSACYVKTEHTDYHFRFFIERYTKEYINWSSIFQRVTKRIGFYKHDYFTIIIFTLFLEGMDDRESWFGVYNY
jgi:hypothetical protein